MNSIYFFFSISLSHYTDPMIIEIWFKKKKHFLEYLIKNPYIEGKINILNHCSHAKYVLEKVDEKKMSWNLLKTSVKSSLLWNAQTSLPPLHWCAYVEIRFDFFLTRTRAIIGVWTIVGKIEDNSFGTKSPVCVHFSKLVHWDRA